MSTLPVSSIPELSAVEKLRLALDLAEAGADVMRAKLRRDHPDVDDAEIARLLAAWFSERPGAELGDAVGRSNPHRFDAE